MKKTLILFSFFALLIACNSTGTKEGAQPTDKPEKEDPQLTQGLELVAKNDCFTCHKVAEKLIGPSYEEVAAKYPDNQQSIDYLADKITKGGSGNWGTIAMLPHSSLSEAEAKLMAKYVLSIK